jgi:hypothetical protein
MLRAAASYGRLAAAARPPLRRRMPQQLQQQRCASSWLSCVRQLGAKRSADSSTGYVLVGCALACTAAGALLAVCDGRAPPQGPAQHDTSSEGRRNWEAPPHDHTVHHAVRLARQNTSRQRRNHYSYVIIGAGTTALAAIEGILQQDPGADVSTLAC